MGQEAYKKSEYYKDLCDYPIPICFRCVFNIYLDIFSRSTISGGLEPIQYVTWKDIESYCNVKDIKLTQIELQYIEFIDRIANDEIRKLKKEGG